MGDVNEPTAEGFTALMLAAVANAAGAATQLLQRGAALERRNSAGRTALFLAASAGAPAALELLIRAGAQVGLVSGHPRVPLPLLSFV